MQPAALAIFDTDGAVPLQQNACGVRTGDDLQIRACEVGREVGPGSAEALAIFVRHLIKPDALLLGTVEIAVHRKSSLLSRLDEY